MSKIFYDYLIDLDLLEKEIKKVSKNEEEKLELWGIVDEIVHNKIFTSILDNLPKDYHLEFMDLFHKAPHDDYLTKYLKEKIGQNFEELIKAEIGNISFELLGQIGKKRK